MCTILERPLGLHVLDNLKFKIIFLFLLIFRKYDDALFKRRRLALYVTILTFAISKSSVVAKKLAMLV